MEERMKSLDAAALAEQDRNTIVPLIKLTPQRELEYAKASLVKNLGINKNSTIASRLRRITVSNLSAANITKFEHQRMLLGNIRRVLEDIDAERERQRQEALQRMHEERMRQENGIATVNATMLIGGAGGGAVLVDVTQVELPRRSKQDLEAVTGKALGRVIKTKESQERRSENVFALRAGLRKQQQDSEHAGVGASKSSGAADRSLGNSSVASTSRQSIMRGPRFQTRVESLRSLVKEFTSQCVTATGAGRGFVLFCDNRGGNFVYFADPRVLRPPHAKRLNGATSIMQSGGMVTIQDAKTQYGLAGLAGAVSFPIEGGSAATLAYRSSLPLSLTTPDNRFVPDSELWLSEDLHAVLEANQTLHRHRDQAPPEAGVYTLTSAGTGMGSNSHSINGVRNLIALPILPDPPSPQSNIYDTVAVLVMVNKRGRMDFEHFTKHDEHILQEAAVSMSAGLEEHFMAVFESDDYSAAAL